MSSPSTSSPATDFDPKYEFEAPQYRDFTKQTPESERALQEKWFDTSRQLDLDTSFDTELEDVQVELQPEAPTPQVEKLQAEMPELAALADEAQADEGAEEMVEDVAPDPEPIMSAPMVVEPELIAVEVMAEPEPTAAVEEVIEVVVEAEAVVDVVEEPVVEAVVEVVEEPLRELMMELMAVPEPTAVAAVMEPEPATMVTESELAEEEQQALPAFESKIFEQKNMTKQDTNKRKRAKPQPITAVAKRVGKRATTTKLITSKRTKIDADKYSVFSMTTRSMKGKRVHQKKVRSLKGKKALVQPEAKPTAKRAKLTKAQGPLLATSRAKRPRVKAAEETAKPSEAAPAAAPAVKPRRGSKQGVTKLTEPEPFTFATDARAKRHGPAEVGEEFVSFKSQMERFPYKGLRSDTPTPASVRVSSGPTKTKTFNFTRSKKRADTLTTEERELEEISEYKRQHAKTGSKFDVDRLVTAKIGHNKIQSTEEQELAAIKALPSFKAQPIRKFADKKSLVSTKKELTVPMEFKLSVANKVPKEVSAPVEAYQFKPLPFNRAIFKVAPQSARAARELTVPVSPGLSKGNRKRKAVDGHSDEFAVFKARPMPAFNGAQAQAAVRPLTTPAPFNLATEDRGADKEERLQQQLQQEAVRAKKQADFVARSLPSTTRNPQPLMLDAPRLTEPEPFNLHSVVLAEQSRAVFQERVSDDIENARQARNFKAKKATVLTKRAFQVRPANQMLTEPAPFDLKSFARAEDRADFNVDKNGRIEERVEEDGLRKREAQEKETKDIAILRKSLVHHPLALPSDENTFVVRPSTAPLTVSKSPLLHTSLRSSARMMR
jgi:hypothetical protein